MNWNRLIRQIHRWTSIVFAGIVAAIFVMLGVGASPAQWVYFLPLPPLFLLLATGLYMFALPYFAKSRQVAG
ncbi:hypothetical protein OF829_08720 [Sphingomonas sp. LB-2]|uniref:hypothetical protein n=1 Tax=Sphingomonas caeni TaxID=2984949 RepID=UPI00222EE1DC|nr:hypothetical protein [Sphingomonas caeni]MCW3847323.1 hypothetical protein [Sphingomonas caeni]